MIAFLFQTHQQKRKRQYIIEMSKIKDDETFFMNTVHLIEAGRMLSDVYSTFDGNSNGITGPPPESTIKPLTIPIDQKHHEWKKQTNIIIKDGMLLIHKICYLYIKYATYTCDVICYDMLRKIKLRLLISAHKICQFASVFRRVI